MKELDHYRRALEIIAEGRQTEYNWQKTVAKRALAGLPFPFSTCVDCPRNEKGIAEPHKCENMGRYDHMP